MSQFTPEWDTHRPDDYRPESSGPYTQPTPVQPAKPPRYAWGTFITVAVLVALFIVGLAVSASRDDTVVPVPNSGTTWTGYDLPSQRSDPTLGGLAPNQRFTPQAHKPGPPVVR
jgi:hypothetical protein